MKNSKLLSGITGLLFIISCFIASAEGADQNVSEGVTGAMGDKKIRVHYTLTVDGEIIDSSQGKEPFEFEVGRRQVIPGFERAVKGMKVGEKKTFKLGPKEGYGEEDPNAFHEVPTDKLPPDIKPKPGMTLYFKGPEGQPLPVRIMEVKKDTVMLNFNHPLAGKTLSFQVEVIDIF